MANATNISTFRSLSNQPVEVLRNEIIDAVSLTSDKVKLVMCLNLLNEQKQETELVDSELENFASSFPKEVLQACVKMGIEDYKAGRCIPHESLMEQIREKRGWK